MKKLIVTADDYGVFPSINQGIIEAIEKDKVNSVACFSNYDDSVKNILHLKDKVGDKADVGCHLTISSGKPLTDLNRDIFTNKGYFRPFGELNIDEIEKVLPELKKELHAQVQNLRDSNIRVNHLSCHHNTLTTTEALFKVYMEVAQETNLPMRSVNLNPKKQDTNYRLVLRILLFDDLPASKRKEIKKFGRKIKEVLSNFETEILTPDLLECCHYGPLPMRDIWEISVPRLVSNKQKDLHNFMNFLIKSANRHGELMLHLIKKDRKLFKEDSKINYPGVNKKYFDSRRVEFDSIMKFDFNQYPAVVKSSWDDLFAKVDPDLPA
ncbi:MAG: ChbG/HpnK family deacetylase [Flavobacteriales bacterium]|nr:ChbG/HpnK family deacetylase [Flavobacteriales bacterium]